MPMTATEILRSSFLAVKDASKYVVVTAASDWTPKFLTQPKHVGKKLYGAPAISVVVHSTASGPDGVVKRGTAQKYRVMVHGVDKNQHLFSGAIMAYCQCDYFTYTCEVALAKRGASRIINSNGAPASVRNPKHIPTACKHLYKVLETLVKKRIG
jgi:hypothetical protein